MDVETSESTSSPGESDRHPELQTPDRSKPMVPHVGSGFRDRLQSIEDRPNFQGGPSPPLSVPVSSSKDEDDVEDDFDFPELWRPEHAELFRSRPIGCESPEHPELNATYPTVRERQNSITSTSSCESCSSDRSRNKPINFKRRDLLPRWEMLSVAF